VTVATSQNGWQSRLHGMNITIRRVCLVVLALYGAIGAWGYVASKSWYENFPGFGMHWVSPMGPYNEHFVKDANAMYLAMAILTIVALRWITHQSVVYLVGASWLTFNVLHLIYHIPRLAMFEMRDRVIGGASLCLAVVLALLLLVPVRDQVESRHMEVAK
jgi:hypothetical protein